MIIGRLTRKARTTIPRAVCSALDLMEGDQIAYHIQDDHVVLTKMHAIRSKEDPLAVFSEWGLQADQEGYADF